MKVFTKDEIEGVRTKLEAKEFKEVFVELEKLKFSYFVVPQSENPDLPDFVLRLTGANESDGELYGISDSVKEDFRPYAVAHEVYEFRVLGINTPDRCTKALEKELALIPETDKLEYTTMRRDFFRNLIPYVKGIPEFYTPGDITQLERNLQKLEVLVQ